MNGLLNKIISVWAINCSSKESQCGKVLDYSETTKNLPKVNTLTFCHLIWFRMKPIYKICLLHLLNIIMKSFLSKKYTDATCGGDWLTKKIFPGREELLIKLAWNRGRRVKYEKRGAFDVVLWCIMMYSTFVFPKFEH